MRSLVPVLFLCVRSSLFRILVCLSTRLLTFSFLLSSSNFFKLLAWLLLLQFLSSFTLRSIYIFGLTDSTALTRFHLNGKKTTLYSSCELYFSSTLHPNDLLSILYSTLTSKFPVTFIILHTISHQHITYFSMQILFHTKSSRPSFFARKLLVCLFSTYRIKLHQSYKEFRLTLLSPLLNEYSINTFAKYIPLRLSWLWQEWFCCSNMATMALHIYCIIILRRDGDNAEILYFSNKTKIWNTYVMHKCTVKPHWTF